MTIRRRAITTAVTALALIGLVGAPVAVAASHRAGPAPSVKEVGQIAYVTNSGAVRLQAMGASGPIGTSKLIGPVTPPTNGQKWQASDLVVSGDGQWVAWAEQLVTKTTFKEALVQYAVVGGKTYRLTTTFYPVGFAKDELVVSDSSRNKTLHLTPTPHLVRFADAQPALAAFPEGVVDATYNNVPHSTSHVDKLRLVTFGGSRIGLHSYTLGQTDYRDIDGAWVSSDAKRVVIERGNHQDFDGLGPSSLADEFSLSNHHRTALGHYGTNAQQWRIASVAFQGSSDKVWVVWERDSQHGPHSVVAYRSGGAWHRFHTAGAGDVAVAGGTNGYLVVQPGKLVPSNPEVNDFKPVATKPAVLVHGGTRRTIGVRGPELVWVTKPLVPHA